MSSCLTLDNFLRDDSRKYKCGSEYVRQGRGIKANIEYIDEQLIVHYWQLSSVPLGTLSCPTEEWRY